MAVALAGRILGDAWSCDSAGIEQGDGADPRAVRIMKEQGLDISSHVSRLLADVAAQAYDLVVSLDASIVTDIRRIAGDLPRLVVWDVPDPYVYNDDTYRDVASKIKQKLELFAASAGGA
jgi:protein-tyrosine-phosphatase